MADVAGGVEVVGGDLQLVLLNACASLQIAEGLVAGEPRKIPWAIGMVEPIYDDDAIDYAVALYDSIAAGRAIGVAHEAALARLELNVDEDSGDRPPAEIPRLLPDDPAGANRYVLARR